MSNIPKGSRQRDLLRELENLHKQVNDLEIKLRGRRRKRDRKGSFDYPDYEAEESSIGDGREGLGTDPVKLWRNVTSLPTMVGIGTITRR